MILDEKLRWFGFWLLDSLKGKQIRTYYDQIQRAWKEGTSIRETEERIRALIAHAVKTTEFYKDYPEDIELTDLPVVNKDTFRQNYEQFLSTTYKDAPDNRVMCTSGSTGTPLRMIQNRDKIRHNTAGGIFLGAAAGYYIGMKEAFIRVWVNNVKKSKFQLFQENYAFPILRYDNGDTAVATRKEKNGRYRLYLDELYGRRSDLIYDCEGKAVTPYIITNNLWDIEGVKQYRFIQEDVKDYTIWLNGDPQKMNQEEILGRIRPYLGEEARIRVELVDEIPVLASGKRKYIENRCEKYKNQTGFCG